MAEETVEKRADTSEVKGEERLTQFMRRRLFEGAKANQKYKLSQEEMSSLPLVRQSPFGLKSGDAETYTPIPANKAEDIAACTFCWRIELHGLKPGVEPIGFDLLGDVILGRKAGEVKVDIDLDPYGAFDKGISRQHAMLRPTTHSLYLFDLQSTNGTQCNGHPVGVGNAKSLSNNDTITLGQLTFQVKIIDGPGAPQDEEVQLKNEATNAALWRAIHKGDSTKPVSPSQEAGGSHGKSTPIF